MTITYYTNFSKRKNSTKQPTGGAEVTVRLKEPTSIENPTFITTSIPSDVNYVQWGSNYYYVEDIKYVTNDIIEIECSMDALATNKYSIIGSSQYVRYYTHDNTEIVDVRLSVKTTPTVSSSSGSFQFLGQSNTNSLILTCVGKDSTNVYATTIETGNQLLNQDMEDYWNESCEEIDPVEGSGWDAFCDAFRWLTDALKSMLGKIIHSGNISNAIRNSFILPLSPSDIGGASQNIWLGQFDTGKTAQVISDRLLDDGANVSIPWQSTDWRRNAPYHEVYLYIPYIGLVQLSASDLIDVTSLNVGVSIDTFSGDAIFCVKSGTQVVGQYHTNLASPYAIGSSNINRADVGMSIAQAIPSIASGNAQATMSATLGLANTLIPSVSCIGSNGGSAGIGLQYGGSVICYTVFHDTTVTPNSVSAIKGTPYNGVMAIPSSGYVECVGASVPSVAYGNEKDAINSYLNGGVYIE